MDFKTRGSGFPRDPPPNADKVTRSARLAQVSQVDARGSEPRATSTAAAPERSALATCCDIETEELIGRIDATRFTNVTVWVPVCLGHSVRKFSDSTAVRSH